MVEIFAGPFIKTLSIFSSDSFDRLSCAEISPFFIIILSSLILAKG